MWSLPRLMKPRDNVNFPDQCYDVCNSLMLEAQSKGEVPSLCDADSAFNNYLGGCNTCIDTYGGTNRTTYESNLAPYLEFCEVVDTYTTIDASWLTTYTTLIPTIVEGVTSLGGISSSLTLYRPVATLSPLPKYFFHQSVQSMISSYIPPSIFSELAHSVSLSAEAASVTGDATSLIYAALEATSVPTWFSAAVPSTYSSQMYILQEQINQIRDTPISLAPPTSALTSSSFPLETSLPSSTSTTGKQLFSLIQYYSTRTNWIFSQASTQRSKAWIAGPVIGGITVICLFALGIFLYRRRRRAAVQTELEGDIFQKTGDKPQLHSDHLPPDRLPPRHLYEMDASHAPSEADDGALPEMAVNEVPARELAADNVDPATSAEEHM